MKKKSKTTMRFLFLMAMALCLSVFAKTEVLALDDEPSLIVAGVDLKDGSTNGSGSGWSYNATTRTITLNGFTYYDNTPAIYAKTQDSLTIELIGNNTIKSSGDGADFAIWADINDDCALTFCGSGKLTISGKVDAINCDEDIVINGCTMDVTSEDNHAIRSSFSGVSIIGATVTATGGNAPGGDSCGIFCNHKPMTIKDSTVVATGKTGGTFTCGLWAYASEIIIDNSIVTATAEAAESSTAGIYSGGNRHDGVIIKNDSVVTVSSAGDTEYSAGIKTFQNIIIEDTAKEVTVSCNNIAMYCEQDFRNGYEGKGWTDAAGTQGEVVLTKNLQGLGNQRTFLARLKKVHFLRTTPLVKTATVTFDANGGTGTMNEASVEKDSAYTLPACTFTPPAGKEFDKWDLGNPGATISISDDITIKAIWKDKTAAQSQGQSASNGQTATDDKGSTETANKETAETVDPKLKGSSVSKLKAGKKSFTITWKKQTAKGIKGYEIQYSTNKKFKKNNTTVKINKVKKTSKKIKKLKSLKKYYVRIRTFKIINSKKVYSKWSKTKNITTK